MPEPPSNAYSGQGDRPALLNLERAELEALIAELGQPPYRAAQLWRAVHQRAVLDFDEMTDLPQALRDHLRDRLRVGPATVVAERHSDDGSTTKSLLRLDDGELVETVLMRYGLSGRRRERKTVCVSTQAGCAMGCIFCATGAQGYRRQLSAGEIVIQVLTMARIAEGEGSPLTNVVFMGMGEPLANYEATHAALTRISDPEGLGMSPRRITVSTVGIPPGIRRLAQDHPQVSLAVSLHAPDQALRKRLVPQPAAGLEEIVAAAREHGEETGRRVSFEYVLMAGINDAPGQARDLTRLLRGVHCHINLIPLNPSAEVVGERPTRVATLAFQRTLTEAGFAATVRVEKGHDILAACGQLRGDRPRPADG